MFKRKDVSNCEIISNESRGRSESLWIKVGDRLALFKPCNYENSDTSEKIVSEVCKLLKISCADIELAQWQEQRGYISYNVLDDYMNEELQGADTLSIPNNPNCKISFMDIRYPSIDFTANLFKGLNLPEQDYRNLEQDFINMILMDYLVANTDRHLQNVGVIFNREANQFRLSPLYDNECSLGVGTNKDYIKSLIESDRKNKISNPLTCKYNLDKVLKGSMGTESGEKGEFDIVMDYLIKNYRQPVNNFIKNIEQNITEENIDDILNKFDIKDLDQSSKEMAKFIIFQRRERMMLRFKSLSIQKKQQNSFKKPQRNSTVAQMNREEQENRKNHIGEVQVIR